MRDFGLAVFIAPVGLATGPQAVAQIKQYGLIMPIICFFTALVPCLAIWKIFHDNGIQFAFPQRDLHIIDGGANELPVQDTRPQVGTRTRPAP
ncbi:MAG: hypothetical protein JJV98_13870 [Desulfosarcina sp.]|nr:hypothetical protein [Desulfobacterales bacterium]